ncbi:PadR family transcriptional regulator [Fodinicola acaciae]|uniref:PadR family transcriptional regulator n=1 Tax=Fodinicola acaciae TaxID=2681555 RepID=UPI0013D001FA|nr:PadR family transcriptional regulator [Fodinicola acaciae]
MDLNATAASLLGFLHDGPMSGWDLMATARARIGNFWSLTQSQVYRELAALQRAGLVSAGTPGARERRPYELTPAGRQAFAEWLSRDPGDAQIRYPLLLAIALGRYLAPGQLAAVIAEHRQRHEQQLASYLAARESVAGDPYAAATLDFGIRHETAVLDWFAALPAQISG